jgi:uncharacterized protein YdhG (YjbR/CyaY superfamily)
MTDATEIFAAFPSDQAAALQRTWDAAGRLLSGADAEIAWGMPTLRAAGRGPHLVSVMGFRRHNSLFPHSGTVAEAIREELGDRIVTKGTIHFDRDRAFPVGLLKRVLAVRIDEVNASYPRSNGEVRVYNRNGSLRSVHRVR